MEEIVRRLVDFCNRFPGQADGAFKIIDYTLRKYGDEKHSVSYWYDKIHEDKMLEGMTPLWADFIQIMRGKDDE